MAVMQAGFKRVGDDHFHPAQDSDPAAQRRLRGQLEQIDYTAFACSKEVASRAIGAITREQFQAMALAAAQARAAWVAEGLKSRDTRRLAELRSAFEELREVYEAARRMVERGYVSCESV